MNDRVTLDICGQVFSLTKSAAVLLGEKICRMSCLPGPVKIRTNATINHEMTSKLPPDADRLLRSMRSHLVAARLLLRKHHVGVSDAAGKDLAEVYRLLSAKSPYQWVLIRRFVEGHAYYQDFSTGVVAITNDHNCPQHSSDGLLRLDTSGTQRVLGPAVRDVLWQIPAFREGERMGTVDAFADEAMWVARRWRLPISIPSSQGRDADHYTFYSLDKEDRNGASVREG